MSASVFFRVLLIITIETRKKVQRNKRQQQQAPVLKFTSSCCLFAFVFFHSTALPDHILERFQRAKKCGKFSRAAWDLMLF